MSSPPPTDPVRTHAHSAEILDRLMRLRRVLPALGEDLASARREAARLRVENGKLRARLHKLELGVHKATLKQSDNTA